MSAGCCIPLLLFFLTVGLSCVNNDPVYTDDVFIQVYPSVAGAVAERDAIELLTFTDHPSADVRSLSWRALAKSDVANPDSLLKSVMDINEHPAWLALSFFELSDNTMNKVREAFSGSADEFVYVCEVFKRLGGEQDLEMILQKFPGLKDKNLCTTAAGRILSREEVSDENLKKVVAFAYDTESSVVRRNLLYGFYRNTLNRPSRDEELWTILIEEWEKSGIGNDPVNDQYMIGILGPTGAGLFFEEIPLIKDVSGTQLIVELIRAMEISGNSAESSRVVVGELLSHDNPVVVEEILEKLKTDGAINNEHLQYIYQNYVQQTRNPVLFVTALELLQTNGWDINPMRRKLDFVQMRHPYLTNRILNIYRRAEPADSFLVRVRDYLAEGGIRGLHAVQVLTDFWIELEDQQQTEHIRGMMREAAEAGNRSVVSGLNTLLTDENLVTDDDFEWLRNRYREAIRAGNLENMSAFEQVLEARFSEREVNVEEPEDPEIRRPNWERLHAIGTRPHWHLETEKGEIVIRLNPLSAPFTVSSVDSLTRDGAYDNVAFHRVVHNFVIQGGDVGRGDGFGGPGYRIPTEPSRLSFERGAVGIASSGTDTEGSQYFVMHQWAPHLDGDYTLFGDVVSGMDVVDRIQVGDRVVKASISVR